MADSSETLVFRDVTLIDGTGADPRPADVLVAGQRITRVGSAGSDRAVRTIDAGGLVLAPGFIDAHSHADGAPLLEQVDVSKISQGVTTEVVGNCGFSLAPCPPERRQEIEELIGRLFPPMPFGWATVAELFEQLSDAGQVTNSVPLVGHNTLRAATIGHDARPPTAGELDRMCAELDVALAAGAAGMSSGLAYPPGIFASDVELVALLRRLSPRHVYATHLRNEGSELLASIDEALTTAQRAGCRLQISHLKAAGPRAWGSIAPALQMMDAAGVDVHHDVYPYEANSTMLASCLPPWFHEGGRYAVLDRLRDPAALRRLKTELEQDDGTWDNWVGAAGWDRIYIASAADPRQEGHTLADLAQAAASSPLEVLVELLVASDLSAWMSAFAMDPEDVRAALVHPRGIVGSDGSPPAKNRKPHPRLFGTFTRVLRQYVRETAVLDWPTAIAKMTALPAAVFGLADRGTVTPGAAADLVLLDPTTVADRATFTDPARLSTGIAMVVVNGVVVFEDGQATGARPGRRLSTDRRE
jgi:N-acyl-D-aspartate/D-glutamate deacylase